MRLFKRGERCISSKSEMKISLITLHRVTNFGSLLQTLATQQALINLGYEVEVVDYIPEGLSFFRAIWPRNHSIAKKMIKFFPLLLCNCIQYRIVDQFLKKYINLTPIQYNSLQELKSQCPSADYYLSGSDQIWNTQNNNPEEDLGAYYLAYTNSKNKIAYAGSFGRDDYSNKELLNMTKWLKEYKAISVREDNGVILLKRMGIEGVHVLDPTLLISKSEWSNILPIKKIKRRYIFVYNLNRNKLIEKLAINIAKEKNVEIVNFADTYEFVKGANNRIVNTPIDFVSYLSQAEMVLTDSFHGVAFSINFERQFICTPPPKYECRLTSILRMFGCERRMILEMNEANDLIENEIDYKKVRELLIAKRVESFSFLKEALD